MSDDMDDIDAPRAKGLAGMKGVARVKCYRGYQLVNCTVDQYIKCNAQTMSKAKLAARGLPVTFIWPAFNDFQGASLLVNAVLDRDAPAIRRLERLHPMADFGLGEWWENLKASVIEEASVNRRTLRSRVLLDGSTLLIEVETRAATGLRAIQAVIQRAGKRVATYELASERFSPP